MRPNKFYYGFLFFIVSTSLVLLSLSYAKESCKGMQEAFETAFSSDLKLVCKEDCLHIKTNEEFTFSITNLKKEERSVVISIPGIDTSSLLVYINGERIEKNGSILGTYLFSPYEERNDYQTFTIKIVSDKTITYGIKVFPYEEENTLEKIIKKDSSVYKESGIYRYYGESPANYIHYQDTVYQIIGLFPEGVKIISPIKGLSVYKKEILYPSLEDYMKSFQKEQISKEQVLSYKSWMSQDRGFWLEEEENNKAYYASIYDGVDVSVKYVDLYWREVSYLPKETTIMGGDGSFTSPYEVIYESK